MQVVILIEGLNLLNNKVMKANAPEKLYLSKNIYGTYLYQVPDPDDETAVEYTRTDALIKKAEKAMIEWAGTYISKATGGCVRERKELATDLLNYFKKYMKGE